MNTDSVKFAAGAKGRLALLKRIGWITGRYGLTPAKMDRALHLFAQVLQNFNCGASFPLTSVVLKRNPQIITKYLETGIEFAVHGYTHIDYSQLDPEQQLLHLQRARQIFADAGINAVGFRSPYLRREKNLYTAIAEAGFTYVSNQPVMWDVLNTDTLSSSAYAAYQRAIDFYDSWSISERVSLPRLFDNLVEIPVSLPDDEILLDRLAGEGELIERTWQKILADTYQRGELFTIQLHPERTAGCVDGLSAVLTEAQTLTPSVWIARLDEIADWWKVRIGTVVKIDNISDEKIRLTVTGSDKVTLLARSVQVDASTEPWDEYYHQIHAKTFTLTALSRPFLGAAPSTSPQLLTFLQEQGYIVEISEERQHYPLYFDQIDFDPTQEYLLIKQIEETKHPLVRLGRWPNGARSALSITGDIDALTLWDYGLRFLGK